MIEELCKRCLRGTGSTWKWELNVKTVWQRVPAFGWKVRRLVGAAAVKRYYGFDVKPPRPTALVTLIDEIHEIHCVTIWLQLDAVVHGPHVIEMARFRSGL
jgi:hypothetical protein